MPNKTLAIVCEGETERIYFQKYRERGSGLKIHILNPEGKTDPENLVKFAYKKFEGQFKLVKFILSAKKK